MIETIKLNFVVSGTEITIPFVAICSVTDKEFGGIVSIEYSPQRLALEYVDTERFVKDLCKKELMAEDLVDEIYKAVHQAIKPKFLKVLVDVHHSKAHQPVKVWRTS